MLKCQHCGQQLVDELDDIPISSFYCWAVRRKQGHHAALLPGTERRGQTARSLNAHVHRDPHRVVAIGEKPGDSRGAKGDQGSSRLRWPIEKWSIVYESIKKEGLKYPIPVRPDGLILGGQHRMAICIALGAEPKTVTTDVHVHDPIYPPEIATQAG